eukprot:CAMPEP_0114541210 /NCGR_PEP_ID=MMETSP0114-20121206/1182_1 /TAXON_ID=31324 /ORGANISM="Goniomonas sp, Strain m" /LENGTH=573 /DNA_ID=CAMNT_0001725429 /DNA_START=123 /DNA_END=1845 /DNA_ORIENTATION=+
MASGSPDSSQAAALMSEADKIGAQFLQLEKFVNLNYTGFHKILKKHDKMHPDTPFHAVYMMRLSKMKWVTGKYNDVLITLSKAISRLRGDVPTGQRASVDYEQAEHHYLVETEDVTRVTWFIMQHLPIWQESAGEQSNQLVNSVYLDNAALELYHRGLDPNSNPKAKVFVELLHRDEETGEQLSQRFALKHSAVAGFLAGTYRIEEKVRRMREEGVDEAACVQLEKQAGDVRQMIESKVLAPTLQVRSMHTVFQIPFDHRVRVTLDTSIVLLSVNPDQQGKAGTTWFQKAKDAVPSDKLHRYAHSVLTVHTSLGHTDRPPVWLSELSASGLVTKVPQFSEFQLGCDLLFRSSVRVRPPFQQQQHSPKLSPPNVGVAATPEPFRSTTPPPAVRAVQRKAPQTREDMAAPLLAAEEEQVSGRPSGIPLHSIEQDAQPNGHRVPVRRNNGCCACLPCFSRKEPPAKVPMRIEPKVFFANERTFLSWLHMAVTMASISIAILAFADTNAFVARLSGIVLLSVAVFFTLYAIVMFHIRATRIKQRLPGPYDDFVGPKVLGMGLLGALILNFALTLQTL